MRFVRILLTSVLLLFPSLQAETHQLDKEKSGALLDDAGKHGTPLSAKATVHDDVGVTAVLLTQMSVRRLFGKEIAETYAVIQVAISNRSASSSFVLHSAYIDTSRWALGGAARAPKHDADDPGDGSSRASTKTGRISSAEARIARGQLLDAQQWSKRNWTIRALTLAGSLASGYSFAFKETGIAKGIAAFNGNLVPGVAVAWPDGSVAQLNRISDFGYQTNKVVAKDAADIIVCFFPIDTFLSPVFRKLFLNSPGLFISPYQLLFEKDPAVLSALDQEPLKIKELRDLYPCYRKIADEKKQKPTAEESAVLTRADALQQTILDACQTELDKNRGDTVELDYIGSFGLENIDVYVDGIMTVDSDSVPASIDQISFDGDASKSPFWTANGIKKGTADCRFCDSGKIKINEAADLGITDVSTIAEGSNSKQLKFSMKLTKPIPNGKKLTFVIAKTPDDKKKPAVDSAPFPYTVKYGPSVPAITGVTVESGKVTVTGSGLTGADDKPLPVSLVAGDTSRSVQLPEDQTPEKLTFAIPAGLPPGCWAVQVSADSKILSKQKILSAAKPSLASATRAGDSITIEGADLVDTSGCGGKALQFRLKATGRSGAVLTPTAKLSSAVRHTEAFRLRPGRALGSCS